MTSKKKLYRKELRRLIMDVEAGATFTIFRKDKPVAVVIPWDEWRHIHAELDALQDDLHEMRRLGEEILPHLGRLTDPERTRPHTESVMATDADEEQLVRTFGKTSDELADEAEQGYDPDKFVRRRMREAEEKLLPPSQRRLSDPDEKLSL